MEIILVNPEGGTSWQDRNKSEEDQYMYPYSLIYLQNYLIKNGIKSEMYDLYNSNPADLIQRCESLTSPIIGVTSQSYNRDNAVDIIRRIKRVNPSSFAVVGGKHFSYCSEETLEKIKEIDVVVRGEGEITFHDLVRALREGQGYHSIKGITYRKGEQIVSNEDRKQEPRIDKFALDYSMIPENNFSKGIVLRNYQNEGIKSLPILLGRGCSQRCIYCSYKKIMYRVRSLESVLYEIRLLKKKYKYSYFSFSDPSFCERHKFVKEFCESLIRENMNIKWYCEARVDTPLELLELMAKAGCISLDFALESGSRKVLKALRKNIDPAQALNFARACHTLGIRTLIFFMISLPEETEEDANQTLEMAMELSKYSKYATLAVAQVLPGTELEIIAREKGILPRDFSWFDRRFYHPHADLAPVNLPLYIENLSLDFIRDFKKKFERIMYTEYSSFADYVMMIKKGMRRISHQSLTTTAKDVLRFSNALNNKIFRNISKRKHLL